MKNIALILEYDGSLFHGWQSQTNASAVQDAVAAVLAKLDGRKITLTGASRTDAGVHARGQVANFMSESRIPPEKYAYALNTLLPAGIACVGSYEAAPDFHARFSAAGKRYSYAVLNRRHPSALLRDRAWHVPLPLDVAAMRAAAVELVGEHDFRAFMSTGSPVNSTVRTVSRVSVDDAVGGTVDGLVHITVAGNGFLYNMVRIIAGTLVYAGLGKLAAADVGRALASGDRKTAGKTAPPQGLCLEQVYYD